MNGVQKLKNSDFDKNKVTIQFEIRLQRQKKKQNLSKKSQRQYLPLRRNIITPYQNSSPKSPKKEDQKGSSEQNIKFKRNSSGSDDSFEKYPQHIQRDKNQDQLKKFTITQLQFNSQSNSSQRIINKNTITPSQTVQNWHKSFTIRSQQRKNLPSEGLNDFLSSEESREVKNNMFMAWKDRNDSKLRLTTSKRLFQQVLKNLEVKRAVSQKNIREVPFDLSSRRLTALPKQRPPPGYKNLIDIPSELIAQKLYWDQSNLRKNGTGYQTRKNDRLRIREQKFQPEAPKIIGWEQDYGNNEYKKFLKQF